MKIDKSWYVKPKDKDFPTDTLSGGVVVRSEEGKLLVALIQDKKFNDYILPKGRLEKGEDVEKAAEREIAEETGLNDIEIICKLGATERLTFKKDFWVKIYFFLYVTKQKKGVQNLQEGEDDYAEVEWFDINNLPVMFWPEQKELIEENGEKIKKLVSNFYHSS